MGGNLNHRLSDSQPTTHTSTNAHIVALLKQIADFQTRSRFTPQAIGESTLDEPTIR
jgi:hypothetical protein